MFMTYGLLSFDLLYWCSSYIVSFFHVEKKFSISLRYNFSIQLQFYWNFNVNLPTLYSCHKIPTPLINTQSVTAIWESVWHVQYVVKTITQTDNSCLALWTTSLQFCSNPFMTIISLGEHKTTKKHSTKLEIVNWCLFCLLLNYYHFFPFPLCVCRCA